MAARKAKTAFPEPGAQAQALTNNPLPAAPAAAVNEEEDPMQNSIRQGRSLDFTPTADVQGGDLIAFPHMVAVAATDIAAGAVGACEAVGVFDLPKDGTAVAQGQAVFVVDGSGTVTASGTGNALRAGVAWADAAGSAGTVAVKINV